MDTGGMPSDGHCVEFRDDDACGLSCFFQVRWDGRNGGLHEVAVQSCCALMCCACSRPLKVKRKEPFFALYSIAPSLTILDAPPLSTLLSP